MAAVKSPTPRPDEGRRGASSVRRIVVGVVLALCVAIGAAVPAGALMTGVDVASFQHPGGAPIDWNAVRAAGHSFAFVKATEGTSYTNPWFAEDWRGAGQAGLFRGAYHFARPALPLSTAVDQARYFVSRTGSMTGGGDLPGVLDLEATGGLGQADLAAWTRAWLGEVQRLTGKAPIIYTGYYFWRDSVGNPTDIGSRYRLWLPSYPSDPNSTSFRPLVPAGWPSWTFWQYTSTGTVPGIDHATDLNRFCCDPGSLAALGGSGTGAGNPFGNLESVSRAPGSVSLSGWTIDPDSTGGIEVHVYVDGSWAGKSRANRSRPDVASSYPGWNANHGFSFSVPVGAGEHRVCAYAINVKAGSTNPELGCRTVVGNPLGSLDAVSSPSAGSISATGWALDPDTTGSVPVDIYVDGAMVGRYGTGVPRPDVASAFNYVANGGYDVTIRGQRAGNRRVCAYAINVGSGNANTALGCRSVAVKGGVPFGNYEKVTPGVGRARVQGWVLDADTTGPVDVHVYVDGDWGGSGRADGNRPDVGAAFPTMGSAHGFSVDVPVPSGLHEVCVYAINVGSGASNPSLGCRTVSNSAAPVGSIDGAGRLYDILGVNGWALDPDTTGPVRVAIQVDGVEAQRVTADLSRPDVGGVFPGYGAAHGFDTFVYSTPGPHRVCVVALNAGAGGRNTSLGCRDL
ncbi:MAG TPA: glycoside hydrolase family 25 protein [Acidimicrobiales bacterium]